MNTAQIARTLAEEARIPLSVAERDLRNVLLEWLSLGVLTCEDGQHDSEWRCSEEDLLQVKRRPSRFPLETEFQHQFQFRFAGCNFLIRFSKQEQLEQVRPMFSHLESYGDSVDAVMDIAREGDGHLIVVHGVSVERIPPTLDIASAVSQEVIRVVYQRYDFLIAVHAAVVGNGRRCVMLPGPSGAGKTTLTVGLIEGGFRYLTDEVAILERGTQRIIPCPLSLRIKEGAWDVVSSMVDSWIVDGLHSDDGKLVRYGRPPCGSFLADPSEGCAVGCIVFPQYLPHSRTELFSMSKIDALRRIHSAGCEASPLMDSKIVEELLEWIEGIDCYEMHVQSLSSAVSSIEELLL
jgi:hypothetical protein